MAIKAQMHMVATAYPAPIIHTTAPLTSQRIVSSYKIKAKLSVNLCRREYRAVFVVPFPKHVETTSKLGATVMIFVQLLSVSGTKSKCQWIIRLLQKDLSEVDIEAS